ncbi:CBO0543 family protein [Paenibacillus flagellatus]|uniref:Uncharacterized protein n=1 Tax=Paenibacillus flagellatus TaxID=2211139 RepID=A0A2V5KSC7_9BACL|nr:CBO0543 family protein [Paenibacillus flagellatus]PYI54507.1 hypothetical protein DLM86_13660 [Paenibacillus flagellatus]
MALTIVSVIVFNLAVTFMPKRINAIETYATALFALGLNNLCDFIFNLQFHLYGYFEEGVDWKGYLVIYGIYPQVNMLFLNFFPFGKGLGTKASYILGWSIFATAYEALATHTEMFYYNGWKWWYSACLYPIAFLLLISNLKVVRLLNRKSAP